MPTLSPALKKRLSIVARQMQALSIPTEGRAPNLKNAKNIFLIRSATPDLFKKAVRELKAMAPNATLHVVSHERDRELIENTCAPRAQFHAYTSGGNYSWESLAPLIPSLTAVKLDTFVMLANNVYGYPHIAEILYKLGAKKLYLFNTNERWFTMTREELEFKTACAGVYQSICNIFWEEAAR